MALLCGAGFTSISLLLIKLSSPSVLSLILALLLMPGGVVASLAVRSQDATPPLLVCTANAVIYAGAIFAALSVFGRRIVAAKMRLALIWLVFPVVILVGLVSVPAFNPLWPRNMTELATEEKSLQNALPLGMGLEESRAVLRSKGIAFEEELEKSQEVLLTREDRSISAAAGDRVISARLETEATQFPCGYDIEVVLLFGPDGRMKDQYIRRLRLCP